MTALSAVRPLVSLYAVQLGAGTEEVGLLFATYSFPQLLFALAAGVAVDRWGVRRPAAVACTVLIAAIYVITLSGDWRWLLLGQALAGSAHIAVLVSFQTNLGSLPNRERNIGWMMFCVSAGQAAGPVMGGVIADLWGLVPAFQAAMGVAFLPLIAAWFLPDRAGSGTGHEAGRADWRMLRDGDVVRVLLVGITVLFALDVMGTYFPLYGMELGLSASAIGLVLTARAVTSMVPRLFLVSIVGRFGRRRALVSTLILGGFSMALFAVVQDFWLLTGVAAMMGLALGLAQPVNIIIITELVSEQQRGKVLAFRLMCNRVATAVSPVFFGMLAGLFGLAPIFYVSGGILAASHWALAGRKAGSVWT